MISLYDLEHKFPNFSKKKKHFRSFMRLCFFFRLDLLVWYSQAGQIQVGRILSCFWFCYAHKFCLSEYGWKIGWRAWESILDIFTQPKKTTISYNCLALQPADYEPPFFRSCTEEEANNPWTKSPLKMEVGNVNSKHFVLALKVRTKIFADGLNFLFMVPVSDQRLFNACLDR